MQSAAIDSPASPNPSVSPLAPGRYRMALQVSNGVLASPTSVVTILLQGSQNAPLADVQLLGAPAKGGPAVRKIGDLAGPLSVEAGSRVTLDATGSTDQDAADRAHLTYTWSQVSGPFPILLPASASVSFLAEIEGT
ncbi:MAG: hypothetical protein HY303_17560 [Candidatus Wallbacteria bacterium]|nr:hypothetical protein [Candidatus Wallbacteria bacterium]